MVTPPASPGKLLNTTAQECKPGGSIFRPPPEGSQLTFEAPPSPARASQVREKKPRRSSDMDEGRSDEGVNTDVLPACRRLCTCSALCSCESAFSGRGKQGWRPQCSCEALRILGHVLLPLAKEGRRSTVSGAQRGRRGRLAATAKPIPADLKYPVATDTVPAGLFKALGAHQQRE